MMNVYDSIPRQIWIAVLGLLLLGGLGWVVTRSGPLAPIKVTVARAAVGVVRPALYGIGVVEARRTYLLGPTTPGRVRQVMVDVGESVKAGQLLAAMDPVDLDARVAVADAAATRARSGMATAMAQVSDAKSRQTLAVAEAQRYNELGFKGFVSSSVVDAKVQQLRSAQAQLDVADSVMASARQDISRLDAERAAAGQQRANIQLLSPTDGVVTSREAEAGSTVIAGQAVLKLMDPASLWIRVRLDQNRSAGLQVGVPAEITLRSKANDILAGKVARIELVSDSVTEERIVGVTFDALQAGMSTGEMAEVTLRLPAVREALAIPNAALRRRGAISGVWLHEGGQLRFALVKTGVQGLDGMMQILDGLKVGDEVIVYSERELVSGKRIKVVSSLQETPE